jgi:4-alpha-glucanotransferase
MGRARLAALHGVATSYEPAPGRTVEVPEATVVAVLAALGVDASTPQAVRAALDEHAHWRANRLLPDTVVLRAPSGLGAGPVPPAPSDNGPQAALSPAAPRWPPLPPLPDGTVLNVETEDGADVPWDGTAFFRGGTTPRTGAAPDRWAAGGLPLGTHTLRAHAPDGRSARATLIVAPARIPAPRSRSLGFLVQLYSLLSTRSWGMGDLGDLAELAAWAGRSSGAGFVQLNPLHSAVPGGGSEPTDPSP